MRLIDADALREKAFGKRKGSIHTADLDAAPTVEPKRGRWMHDKDDELHAGYCSCCGWMANIAETDVADMPFCPNCGARMEGGEAND